ncbi:hypothetical protein M405DRAFT_873767 [Rhizopogon salebrosus TDB-379]|nr:hypothetical protein M405DRAFT_873767 [Rhizopogon salebrosus TDB-379]
MGRQQAYRWPVIFPDFVERFVSTPLHGILLVARIYCSHLIALLNTWQSGDVSIIHDIHDGGDYEKGLKSIEAKTLVMPSKTDFHCPLEDSEIEVTHLRDAVIPAIWGHLAGANPSDVIFISEDIGVFVRILMMTFPL